MIQYLENIVVLYSGGFSLNTVEPGGRIGLSTFEHPLKLKIAILLLLLAK